MPWFLNHLMRGNLNKGWIAQDRGCQGTWKVSDCMEGVTRVSRDCVAEKGRSGIYLFWSLSLLDGIRCTLGVRPGIMSQYLFIERTSSAGL